MQYQGRLCFALLLAVVSLAVVPFTAEAKRKSEKCCSELADELGFANKFGSDEVCGDSAWNGQACKKAATFRRAKVICSRAGARLCTRKELLQGETKRTGCKMEGMQVWTSSSCDSRSGRVTAKGGNGRKPTCVDKSDKEATAAVRCCADACEDDEPESDEVLFKVGLGTFSDPYYAFQDSEGNALSEPPSLERGKTYTFERIVSNSFHPFSLFGTAGIVIDGDTDAGIEAIGETLSVSIPADYAGELSYFCTAHGSMTKKFVIV